MAGVAGAAQVATIMAQPYEAGGLVKNIQLPVQHFGTRDTVPAMLTPGEAVIKKSVVDQYGQGGMDRFARTGDTSGLGGGDTYISIYANDAKSFKDMLSRNEIEVAEIMQVIKHKRTEAY